MPAEQQRANDEQQLRTCQVTEFRVLREENKAPEIVGYAALFDQVTEIGGWFYESIAPGAFADSLSRGDDVRSLFNHDANLILGRTKSNTLFLKEDEKGLHTRTIPAERSYEKDLLVSIERGDVSQMSFGFYIDEEQNAGKIDGKTHYRITKARLFDISPVTFPAYPQTEVEVQRSLERRAAKLAEHDPDIAAAHAFRTRQLQIISMRG